MRTAGQPERISQKSQELLRDLKKIIHRFVPDAEVLLYGSVARGTPHSESDYDILVLMDHSISAEDRHAVRDAVYDLELAHQTLVSLIFCTRDQWNRPAVRVSPFRQEVERDAVLL